MFCFVVWNNNVLNVQGLLIFVKFNKKFIVMVDFLYLGFGGWLSQFVGEVFQLFDNIVFRFKCFYSIDFQYGCNWVVLKFGE